LRYVRKAVKIGTVEYQDSWIICGPDIGQVRSGQGQQSHVFVELDLATFSSTRDESQSDAMAIVMVQHQQL